MKNSPVIHLLCCSLAAALPASAQLIIDDFSSPAASASAESSDLLPGPVSSTQTASSALGGSRRYIAELSNGATGTIVSGYSGAGQFGYFSLGDDYDKGTSTFPSDLQMTWGGALGEQLNQNVIQQLGSNFEIRLDVDTFDHVGLNSVDLVLYLGSSDTYGNFTVQSVPFNLTTAGTAIWSPSSFTGVNFADLDYVGLTVNSPFATGSEFNIEFSNFVIASPVPEPASLMLGGLGAVGLLLRRRRA